jgi:hypothetical protein
MKTPLQQFAEWYNQYVKDYDMYPNEWECNKMIEMLLPIEQKAFEDAAVHFLGLNHHSPTDCNTLEIAKDYFEQTFKTEKR